MSRLSKMAGCDEAVNGELTTAMETAPDEEGNVLVLERVSVKPYRSQDEYIYAMKEDLAEWFNKLYSELSLTENNFFNSIETGVILCQHANTVQNYIHDFTCASSRHSSTSSITDAIEVLYRRSAKPGSFQSRDNISNFLHWCRTLAIADTILFETEDLVSRKNVRNVVLCLLEVARRGAKYGVPAPTIIEMEQEIDREIEDERNPQKPPTPPVQRKTCDMMSLDALVRELIGRCTCPDQFPIIRVSEGKYKIGDNETLIFVRVLRNHVMVRIGGGWDTLENYLNRHDPCRCAAKGHKGSRSATPLPAKTPRRASTPAKRSTSRPKTPKQRPSIQENNQRLFGSRPVDTEMEAKPKQLNQQTSTTPLLNGMERKERKAPSGTMPFADRNPPTAKRPGSPAPLKRPPSPSPIKRAASPAFGRPASPGPMRASPMLTPNWAERRDAVDSTKSPAKNTRERKASTSSNSSAPEETNNSRGRTTDRRAPGCAKRSGSATRQNKEEALFVRRDSTGKHIIDALHETEADKKEPVRRLSSSGRLNMTADQLLPSKIKLRSQNSTSSDLNLDTDSDLSPLSVTAPEVMMSTPYSKQKRSTMTKARTVSSIPNGRLTPVPHSKENSMSEAHINTSKLKRPSSAGGDRQERGRAPQRQRPATARSSSSSRIPGSPSRKLPETPKKLGHSKTVDIPDAKADIKTNLSQMRRNSLSSANFSLSMDFEDYPDAPPENEDLNAKMELLFEEYKKVELSLKEKAAESKEQREKEKESKKKEQQKHRRSRSVTREMILSGSSVQPGRPSRTSSSNRPSVPVFGASTVKPPEQRHQHPARKSVLASMANPPNANARNGHARSSSVGRIPLSHRTQSIDSFEETLAPQPKTIPKRPQTPLSRSSSQSTVDTPCAVSRESRSRKPSSSGLPRSQTPKRSGQVLKPQPKKEEFEVENGVINMVHEDIVIDESSVINMVYQGEEEGSQSAQNERPSSANSRRLQRPSIWRKSPSAKVTASSECSLAQPMTNGHSRTASHLGLSHPNDEPACLTNGYGSSNGSLNEGQKCQNASGGFGFRSRLPMPSSFKGKANKKLNLMDSSLKRCDSGVDINNLCPSDNSNHGDDDGSSWQASEGTILQPVLNDPLDLVNDDEYY